jgi:hypothetical protein
MVDDGEGACVDVSVAVVTDDDGVGRLVYSSQNCCEVLERVLSLYSQGKDCVILAGEGECAGCSSGICRAWVVGS